MKTVTRLFLFALLVALTAGCSTHSGTPSKDKEEAQLLPGTLGASEVTALFWGNTVESVLDSSGRTSLTHYSPNGTLSQLQNNEKRSGTWRVRKDGRMCLKFYTEPELCRFIAKEGSVYYKYIFKTNGKHERILTYKSFRKGNFVN